MFFSVFFFGPKAAGKSALVSYFLGRTFADNYTSTTEELYAVNVVDLPGGTKKTLVLREIPEDGICKLLSDKESLAACDVAVFVHDSSNAFSWERAAELLVEVASHGEDTGFEVSQDMGIEAPIPISVKLRDLNMFSIELMRFVVTMEPGLLLFGAAVAIVGLAAYRVYAARKNASS
ncbi:Mitochondrial Rho GTPase 1 [Morella rubra]|uniref:Mitochondrial Rho GTPase 1 n=1 Tax=Morella rubra TaxID=262757 RepID=A0A6A1UR38_9ROSI|nr:Mitochondrial Rho GTPase 1 [Morella rubra]